MVNSRHPDRTAVPVPPPTVTSFEQANAIVQQLADCKAAWIKVSLADRISLLQHCVECVQQVAASWAMLACQAKGIAPTSVLAGEEWLIGPTTTLAHLQQLIKALKARGQPQPPKLLQRHGQTIAQVFPDRWYDRILWWGFRGEVWLQPNQPATQGKIYREVSDSGQVALVLGAGNVSSIALLDMLYQLFAANRVVLLKLNPVNEYLGPILEQAFQPLRAAGCFALVYGGAELGQYLCQHPSIDIIHVTGSHQTYDAIVWGSSPTEQTERKAAHKPLNLRPITAELGCVTPVLVVPGDWSERDLAFQARHVAGMVAHNASFNCASAQVLVTAKGWAQREAFLEQVRQELAKTPDRLAYYPGAKQRFVSFLERYPQAQAAHSGSDDIIPWTLIPDVPCTTGEFALTQEAFCGILAETSLEASNSKEFLTQAARFCNEKIWGNLSCTILIDPVSQQEATKELEQAIAGLQYGAIGVNVWSGVIYSLPAFPWGAFPGNSSENILSGAGVVHNTYLFDAPQKSVLYAPFRIFPTPSWFARHSNLLQLAKRYTQFQAKPSWHRFLAVIVAALQA